MVSKKVAEQIRYLEAKTRYEKILRENKALNEDIFDTIGAAFGDIFKNFKLALMDISNRLQFKLKKIIYSGKSDELSRQKFQKAVDDYKRKHDKIYTEWTPLVQKNLDAITSFDPLLGLAISPGKYLASKGIELSLQAGKNAVEVIAAEPWASVMKLTTDFGGFGDDIDADPEEIQRRRANAELLALNSAYEQLQNSNNINARLANLFLKSTEKKQNESLISKKSFLSEQVQQGRSAIIDPEKWIDQVFDHMGIQNTLNEIAIQLASNNILLMKSAIPLMNTSVSMMQVVASKNFDDFENAIKKITSEKKVEAEKVDELNELLQQAKEKIIELTNNPKFKKALAAKNKNTISQKELTKIASDEAFNELIDQIKQKFNESLEKANPIVQKAIIALPKSKNDPVVQDITSAAGKQKLGKLADEFIKVYEEYAGVYDDFKKLRKQ
jgi:hypothetical protein